MDNHSIPTNITKTNSQAVISCLSSHLQYYFGQVILLILEVFSLFWFGKIVKIFSLQKSRKQENQETVSGQERSNSFRTTFQQRVASNSVTQDGIKKVPLKPETTKRQDDVTLSHHTDYAQQKMKPSCSHRYLPEMGNNSAVCPKWVGLGY